ncbi:MAG: uroporphyrinogen decarboxylase family protein [Thermoproteota archaeon]
MLPAERLDAAFEGKYSDAMPWFADLTYWCHAHEEMGTLPQKYWGENRINLYMEMGCGAHEELYRPVFKVRRKQVKVHTYESREPDGSVVRREVFETPIGDLKRVSKRSTVSHSSATVEHPVKTASDLKRLRFILRDQVVEKDPEMYEWQLRMMRKWAGWGIVSSLPPRTPLMRMIVEWAGFSNTVKLQWMHREEFDETIQVMCEEDDPIYEAVLEAPAKYVYFGENLSSDMVSPRLFKTYLEPYYKKRTLELHAKGKRVYLHIDGGLRGLLPLLAQTGVDCAQSLTPAPAGDVDVKDFRKIAGENIVLWGGLPGVLFSKKYPVEMLRQVLDDIVETYLNDRRFIIGVADQVPPDGEIERVKMVSETVESRGRR